MDEQDRCDRSAELAFERELLESAAADGVAADAVGAAWSRFALALGTTATHAGVDPTYGASGAKLAHGARRALGWVSLGAVGGGVVAATLFAVFGGNAPSRTALITPATAAVAPAASTVLAPASPSTERAVATPDSSTPARAVSRFETSDPERPPQHRATPHRRDGRELAAQARAPANAPQTALAAEIALLDDVRRATGAGDCDHALALLELYHREHPNGELRREADVLTMQALSQRGDRDAAAQLARRFLDAFPDDPHVTRVQTFAR